MSGLFPFFVMAGLDPAIHVLMPDAATGPLATPPAAADRKLIRISHTARPPDVDGRVKPGHDDLG